MKNRDPRAREEVELLDGTIYLSGDNWQTVWKARRGTGHRRVTDKIEADRNFSRAFARSKLESLLIATALQRCDCEANSQERNDPDDTPLASFRP